MLTRACTLALVLLAFAGDAAASELIGRDGGRASLQVNGSGQAHVAWSEDGATRHLVAGNAINARPPRPGLPQVSFQLRYGARSIAGAGCGDYDGPPLAWLVVACKAPDGSYWALQRWARLKPNYGGRSGEWELRLSHWSGPLPRLELWTDWAYRRFDHLYGRYTYRGEPVHGFRVTPRATRSTTMAATSSWTRWTLATDRVGGGRTAFSRNVRTEPSATASTGMALGRPARGCSTGRP